MRFQPSQLGYAFHNDNGDFVCSVVTKKHEVDPRTNQTVTTPFARADWTFHFTGRALSTADVLALAADLPKE